MHDDPSLAFNENAIPHQEALRETPSLIIAATEHGFLVLFHDYDSDQPQPHVVSINQASDLIAQALERGAQIQVITGVGHGQ